MLVPLLQNIFGAAGEVITPVTEPGAFRFGFSSYPAFRATLQTLIDGDDFSQSTLSSAILDLFVLLGEKRLYRDVRSSTQDAALTLTVANNSAPLPFDTVEIRSLYFVSGIALQFKPYEEFQTQLQMQGQTARKPVNFTQEGDNVIFWPSQADGTVINGRYYRQYASIVTSGTTNNPFFTRWPELWLSAALLECIPYVGEVTRADIYRQRYEEMIAEIMEYERRRVTRGSKLVTRVA